MKRRFWFVVDGHVDYEDDSDVKFESMPCVRVYIKREDGAELITPKCISYVSGMSDNLKPIMDRGKHITIKNRLARYSTHHEEDVKPPVEVEKPDTEGLNKRQKANLLKRPPLLGEKKG